MRRVAAMALISVVGCFHELPAPPAASEGASAGASSGSTSGGEAGSSGGEAGSSGGSGAATGAESTSDADAPTSGTTGTAEPPQGLFACEREALCGPWDCSGGCGVAGPVGTCVLTALRDRASGALEVEVSAQHRLVVRGAGSEEVSWQWRMGAPATYSELRRCALKSVEFFDGCLQAFTPDCADPSEWVGDCATVEQACP